MPLPPYVELHVRLEVATYSVQVSGPLDNPPIMAVMLGEVERLVHERAVLRALGAAPAAPSKIVVAHPLDPMMAGKGTKS